MELAQISGDRLVEKAHAVMLAAAVEIGMKSGRNQQLQFDRRRKCRPAERPCVTMWMISGRFNP